jgi:hypothetical protein
VKRKEEEVAQAIPFSLFAVVLTIIVQIMYTTGIVV